MSVDTSAVPALIAELAAGLNVCACGALPGACLEHLTGPWRDVCCPSCAHYPELPHAVDGVTHAPEVCGAWADAEDVPRAVACAAHWEPVVVGEWRRDVAAREAALRAVEGPRTYWHRERLTAEVEHREGLGPDPRR